MPDACSTLAKLTAPGPTTEINNDASSQFATCLPTEVLDALRQVRSRGRIMLVRPRSPIIGDHLEDTVEGYLSRESGPILPRFGENSSSKVFGL